jgi:hypothetical protein
LNTSPGRQLAGILMLAANERKPFEASNPSVRQVKLAPRAGFGVAIGFRLGCAVAAVSGWLLVRMKEE